MVSKINADTSDGLKITSDTSGTLDIQSGGTTKMTVGSTIDLQGNELVLDADADTSIHADTDDQIDFRIGGTDKAHFDSSGNFYVGSISAPWTATSGINARLGATFPITATNAGIVCIFNRNTDDGTLVECKRSGSVVGSIGVTASGTSFNTSSDYRLKENVEYTFDATTELKKLKPCKFNFIGTSETIEGFVAHELSEVVPLAVTGTKDAVDDNGDAIYQGIDQSKLVPLLVKTIQELEARITALESE
jgi:hypothetical protein